ncbi:MAG: hypothetical protein AAF821_26735 [Cyanobacteria bacterium P01_D01_bin.156]
MAGLFGLFGGNKNKTPQSKEPFFLSEDEAKTYGDIDYMRKEVVVRRTFAKKKGQTEEMESVRSISSSSMKAVGEAVQPAASSVNSFNTPTFNTPAVAAPVPPAPPAPIAEPAPAPVPTASESEIAAETAEKPAAPAAPSEPVAPTDTVKRTPDNSMDMFRNMAKNMRR